MAGISNNLHNNHNVYILGAGFSRRRGLPLIQDFMTQMRDALEYHAGEGHSRECAAIEAVLEFRLKASAAAYRIQIDLENIEDLFSLASASPGQLEEHIKLAIAATLDFAIQAVKRPSAKFNADADAFTKPADWNAKLRFGEGSTESYWTAPAYEYIVRALVGGWDSSKDRTENSFITFNYDTLLEDSLDGLGIGYSLGFDAKEKLGSSMHAKVLKLHGSVNWAVPKGARTKIEVMGSYRSIVEAGLTPEIIPPTWKKDSRGAFDEIWHQSLKVLADATRVVVLGFSMPPTDLHFKYLLAAGLRENYSLREIVFVNPGTGMDLVKKRCEDLFANQVHNAAKLRFINSTVEDFVGQGTDTTHVGSIGRLVHKSIQQVNF
ncbi:MAG: SIR2 family protein [Anaerolineales bacterium]|nr:SIR2 family protein [Anaerolineales bacterium]